MNKKSKTLVSWIGTRDLRAWASAVGKCAEQLLTDAGIESNGNLVSPSPLKIAAESGLFDRFHLISDYQPDIAEPFSNWLGIGTDISQVTLKNYKDFNDIYRHAHYILKKLNSKSGREIALFLTPGSSLMAVCWVLLGKTKSLATLWQISSTGQMESLDIPDTFFNDLAPEMIRDRDEAFQNLAFEDPSKVEGFERLVGNSPKICACVAKAKKAAVRDISILLLGETGTGKEMFAHAIHKASPRRKGPFRAVNCAAIPGGLLESQLFGHKKGAFTGADSDRKGEFELANDGTLFLDEIGECPPELQSKLLRVLQPPPGKPFCSLEYNRVGDPKSQFANVRIIAATNRDLLARMESKLFREDLYYRIAPITINLPPLRERAEDIALIAKSYLQEINTYFYSTDKSYRHKKFSKATIDFITKRDWPGNIRELNNAISQAAVFAAGETIEINDFHIAAETNKANGSLNLSDLPLGNGFKLEEQVDLVEKHYIEKAIEQVADKKGKKAKAAELLGLKSYQTMDGKMNRLGVRWESR